MQYLVRKVFPAAADAAEFPVVWRIFPSHDAAWREARRHAQWEQGEAVVIRLSDSEAALLACSKFVQDEPPAARAYDEPRERR